MAYTMETTPHLSHERLLARVQQGDRPAFQQLYLNMLDPVYAFVQHFLKDQSSSEEIVQDTFLKLWINRHQLAGIRSAKAYCLAIAKNLMLEHLRREKMADKAKAYLALSLNIDTYSPLEQLAEAEYTQITQEALALLPERRRKIFTMSRDESLTYLQISQKTGLSVVAVKKQMMLALAHIRNYLHKHTDIAIALACWVSQVVCHD